VCMWLCRSGEFQYQAERVLENTLSNIMREAQRGEFLVTARPRLIALPPRQLPAVSAPSLPASLSATRVSADTLAAATATRAPTRAVPAAAATPSAAAAAPANPTATANRESRAHRDAHVTPLAT